MWAESEQLCATHRNGSVLPFQPKYRLGHPENHLFSLSVKMFSGSKYPENSLFHFEEGSTGMDDCVAGGFEDLLYE